MTWWGYAVAAVISAGAVLGSQWLAGRRQDANAAADRRSRALDRLFERRLIAFTTALSEGRKFQVVRDNDPDEIERLDAAATSLQDVESEISLLCEMKESREAINALATEARFAQWLLRGKPTDDSKNPEFVNWLQRLAEPLGRARSAYTILESCARVELGVEPISKGATPMPVSTRSD